MVFFAAVFLAVVFLDAVFLAVVFLAVVFLAVVFLAVVFFAVVFFAAVFRVVRRVRLGAFSRMRMSSMAAGSSMVSGSIAFGREALVSPSVTYGP